MPRPILGTTQSRAQLQVDAQSARSVCGQLTGAKLEQRLRQPRSKRLSECVRRLDAGSHQQDLAGLEDLLEAIAHEFPELSIDQRPSGIVSRCYLGAPYVVHICDLSGNIIEHFEAQRAMPPQFERARSLALHPAYAFVEVYATELRAVAEDGAVSVIAG